MGQVSSSFHILTLSSTIELCTNQAFYKILVEQMNSRVVPQLRLKIKRMAAISI